MAHPTVVTLVVNLVIFLLSVPVPGIVSRPISCLTTLGAPLPVVVVNCRLTDSGVLGKLGDLGAVFTVLLELVVVPSLTVTIV